MMPSKFKPEYSQQAEDYIAKGHAMDSFAHTVGVSRETVYNWKEAHPEFKEALDRGFSKRQALLESMLMKCAYTSEGNVTALIFLGKNWAGMRDRMEVDSNVKAAVEIADKHDPKLASTVLEFEQRLRELIARKPDASQEE
jgi:transposase-like protein